MGRFKLRGFMRYLLAILSCVLVFGLSSCWQKTGETALSIPNESMTINMQEDSAVSGNAPGILADFGLAKDQNYQVRVLSDVFNGTLELSADGAYNYKPHEDFYGTDSFLFQLLENEKVVHTGTVIIDIANIPDPPKPEADSYSTKEDVPLHIKAPGILANDKNPDGGDLELVLASKPEHGTLTFNDDGSFRFQPQPHWHGVTSFTYHVISGEQKSEAIPVEMTVTSVNDRPRLKLGTMVIDEGGTVQLTKEHMSGTDVDSEDPKLVFQVKSLRHGVFRLKGDNRNLKKFSQSHIAKGNVQFLHNRSNNAPAFVMELTDGQLRVEQRMNIEFKAVNDPPVWKKIGFRIKEGQRIGVNLLNIHGLDEETKLENLRFKVGKSQAIKVTDQNKKEIKVIRPKQLKENQIFIEHNGTEEKPQLELILTDGHHNIAKEMKIIYEPINDAPKWQACAFPLTQGKHTVLKPTHCAVTDADNVVDKLLIKVLKADHMHFAFANAPQKPIHQWQYQALAKGSVIAVHNGSVHAATCVLQVSDGKAHSDQEVQVAFTRVYKAPQLLCKEKIDITGQLPFQQRLGELMQLAISDEDSQSLDWFEIKYTANPELGVLLQCAGSESIQVKNEGQKLRLQGKASLASYLEALRSLEVSCKSSGTHIIALQLTCHDGHKSSDPHTCNLHLQIAAAPVPEEQTPEAGQPDNTPAE